MTQNNSTTNQKIAVLGTGIVGQTIAKKLVELGYLVTMGSRTANNDKAVNFTSTNKNAQNGTFEDVVKSSDIIFNCTAGNISLEVLKFAGLENFKNKILIDISNPLDFSNGFPPTLSICNDNSIAQEIQKLLPDCFVVKALNTMNCDIMVNPSSINNGDHNTFIAGNDENSKSKVIELLNEFGWSSENIIDLGDITNAIGLEMYLPLWLRIFGATKTGAFNIKIVK